MKPMTVGPAKSGPWLKYGNGCASSQLKAFPPRKCAVRQLCFRQTREKCDGSNDGDEKKKSIMLYLMLYPTGTAQAAEQQSTLSH